MIKKFESNIFKKFVFINIANAIIKPLFPMEFNMSGWKVVLTQLSFSSFD